MPAPIKVVFLGTSATVPNLERRQSSTAVIINGETILVDVGEDVQRAIIEHKVKTGKKLTILITHYHPDHCQGLMALLTSMDLMGRKRPVRILGPKGLIEFLNNFFALFKTSVSYPIQYYEIEKKYGLMNMDDWILEWFKVDHFGFSLGYSIIEKDHPGKFDVEKALELGIPKGPLWGKLQRGEEIEVNGQKFKPSDVLGPSIPGRKIVFSGDTKPTEILIETAKGADLLIHEGTFPHWEKEKHKKYKHSRTIDAAVTAKLANVKKLAINHISSRISDVAEESEIVKKIFPNSIIAYDGLRISL